MSRAGIDAHQLLRGASRGRTAARRPRRRRTVVAHVAPPHPRRGRPDRRRLTRRRHHRDMEHPARRPPRRRPDRAPSRPAPGGPRWSPTSTTRLQRGWQLEELLAPVPTVGRPRAGRRPAGRSGSRRVPGAGVANLHRPRPHPRRARALRPEPKSPPRTCGTASNHRTRRLVEHTRTPDPEPPAEPDHVEHLERPATDHVHDTRTGPVRPGHRRRATCCWHN